MAGITVAHHDSNDSFVASSPYPSTRRKSHVETPTGTTTVVPNDPISQLLSAAAGGEGVVEDLTGEVQDLMMRESMASWLQQPFGNPNVDLSGFDAHQLSLQLENLFSQGDLTEMPSPFYDEMMFVSEGMSAPMSAATTPLTSPQMPQEEEIQVVEEEEEDITLQELDELVPIPQQPEKQNQLTSTALKRRLSNCSSSSSSSSEDDSDSSSDSSDEEEESPIIPTTVANLGNRQYWSSSDESESESEAAPTHHRSSRPSSPVLNHQYQTFAYMHKRQIEETLLDKITNQLQPDKLPGILAIISHDRGQQQQATEEVEIDLSCLARDQLVRLLAYVEACIAEQSGGPTVDLANYLVREKKPSQSKKVRMVVVPDEDDESDHPKTPKRGQQQQSPRRRCQRGTNANPKARSRKSRQELTEDILADDDDDDDDDDDIKLATVLNQHQVKHEGPMSMAQLTKRQAEQERSRRRKQHSHQRSNKRSKVTRDEDAVMSSGLGLAQQQQVDSIAVSRPKRRAALHKRRIMEDMFHGSDGDDNSEDEGTLIVFSNEQMDFNVKDNKTIVHKPSRPSTPEPETVTMAVSHEASAAEEEEDEEIDIML